MSEQNNGKAKSSVSTIVATAIVALAAVAAIIVLLVMNKSSEGDTDRGNSNISVDYKDTQEFADECGENAQKLVAGNYKVLRLFISEGLPHKDEPYGNRPEDGFYTAVSDEFKTYEDLESFVRSIFIEQEANRILTNMPLDPAAVYGGVGGNAGKMELYRSRDEYVDASAAGSGTSYVKQSVLGINMSFKPYTDYKKPWGSTSIRIVPVSEEECELTIYLGADKDVDLSSVEDTDILNTKMVKENGEWRLAELVF